jgi:hypothetical protein
MKWTHSHYNSIKELALKSHMESVPRIVFVCPIDSFVTLPSYITYKRANNNILKIEISVIKQIYNIQYEILYQLQKR